MHNVYLYILSKSYDFEGFEAEVILTERAYCIPPLDQANAFEFEGLHTTCAGAMNKENGCNEYSTVTVPQ